jgi:hypothetical protein
MKQIHKQAKQRYEKERAAYRQKLLKRRVRAIFNWMADPR